VISYFITKLSFILNYKDNLLIKEFFNGEINNPKISKEAFMCLCVCVFIEEK